MVYPLRPAHSVVVPPPPPSPTPPPPHPPDTIILWSRSSSTHTHRYIRCYNNIKLLHLHSLSAVDDAKLVLRWFPPAPSVRPSRRRRWTRTSPSATFLAVRRRCLAGFRPAATDTPTRISAAAQDQGQRADRYLYRNILLQHAMYIAAYIGLLTSYRWR